MTAQLFTYPDLMEVRAASFAGPKLGQAERHGEYWRVYTNLTAVPMLRQGIPAELVVDVATAAQAEKILRATWEVSA